MASVTLRPATRQDTALIRSWLAHPDIQAWWGPLSSTEAEVNIALGSDHAICRIIECDGVAAGYCHAIDATVGLYERLFSAERWGYGVRICAR